MSEKRRKYFITLKGFLNDDKTHEKIMNHMVEHNFNALVLDDGDIIFWHVTESSEADHDKP